MNCPSLRYPTYRHDSEWRKRAGGFSLLERERVSGTLFQVPFSTIGLIIEAQENYTWNNLLNNLQKTCARKGCQEEVAQTRRCCESTAFGVE